MLSGTKRPFVYIGRNYCLRCLAVYGVLAGMHLTRRRGIDDSIDATPLILVNFPMRKASKSLVLVVTTLVR